MKTVYFTHARVRVPAPFQQRMDAIRGRIGSLPGIVLLPCSLESLAIVDLFIGVLDLPSYEVFSAIRSRLTCFSPRMKLFYQDPTVVEATLLDLIESARNARIKSEDMARAYSLLPNPIRYRTDDEIVGTVENFEFHDPTRPEVLRVVH